MKVQFLEACFGEGGVYQKGSIHDLPENIAKPFVKSGIAKLVSKAKTATSKAAASRETATKK